MKSYLYHIETITNLHVGSGEINQGVVDNLVQRDAVTDFPIINASSLKGALRQHFNENCREIVSHVFGSQIKNNGNSDSESNAGAYRFFEAKMLSMPVRSDKCLYLKASCPQLLNEYHHTLGMFGIEHDATEFVNVVAGNLPSVCVKEFEGARIEDLTETAVFDAAKDFSSLAGSPCVLLNDKDFKLMCDDEHLPIIARNHLNNGQSKNLWYEQVVPRMSKMYFVVMVPDDDKCFEKFNEILTTTLVQIGGNASVGNGFCKMENIYGSNK